ncbi:MAG: hypothetical protein ABSF71_02805 [Terriglobia bacterium]|jgi:hypothetical protein
MAAIRKSDTTQVRDTQVNAELPSGGAWTSCPLYDEIVDRMSARSKL